MARGGSLPLRYPAGMQRVAFLLRPAVALVALVGCRDPNPETTPPVDTPVEQAPTGVAPRGPGVLEISVGACAISPDARVWCRGSDVIDEDPGWIAGATEVEQIWLVDETLCARSDGRIRCVRPEDSLEAPLPVDAQGWLSTPNGRALIDVAWDGDRQCLVDDRGEAWCRWMPWRDDVPIPPLERYPIAGVRDIEIADEIGCMLLADQSVHCFFGAGILMVSELDPALAATVADYCAALPSAPTCDQPIGGRVDWPAPFRVLDKGRDIAVGSNYACLIDDRGAVGCVTVMEFPGEPRIGDSHDFAAIPGLPPMIEIDGSDEHVCGRSEADEVWCWGSNEYGQLGDGTTTSHPDSQPVKVGRWPGLRQISVGFSKSCVVTSDATECWGWLADDDLLDEVPTEIPGVRASALASREYTTCAREGQTWKCWGAESGGFEGATGAARIVEVDRFADKPAPECEIDDKHRMTCFDDEGVLTWDIPDVIDTLPGYSNVCVLLDRHVACLSPTLPSLGQTEFEVPASTIISGLDWHGCVLDTRGKPHCWAGNDHVLQAITLDAKLVGVVATMAGDCGLDRSGKVHCWGDWEPDAKSFTLGLTNIVELVGTNSQVCGRDQHGVVSCWGDEIVADTAIDPRKPQTMAVPASKQIVAGFDHVCSLAIDGRVSCWGGEIESQRARVSRDFSLRPKPVDFFGP